MRLPFASNLFLINRSISVFDIIGYRENREPGVDVARAFAVVCRLELG